MSASSAENSSTDSSSHQTSGDSTSQGNTSGAVQYVPPPLKSYHLIPHFTSYHERLFKQVSRQARERGGTGMEKTGADPDAGGDARDASQGTKSNYNSADEPDFMKRKPGNPPTIMSQIREKLQEGTTRSE
ncbi:hypothetical protein BDZ45DRAFT_749108 [Acephala macrosclerotiorum]|nr:hypothetical protein BDZ45DRAFT_749108 [Acephala macrosclerotiorum]